jgi:biotin operon repressor
MTKKQACLEMIMAAKEQGISTVELVKKTNSTISNVMTVICRLRQEGHNIKSIQKKYYYYPKKEAAPLPISKELQTVLFEGNPITLQKKDEKQIASLLELSKLEGQGLEDYLDMVQKSAFYAQCAAAVVESHKVRERLRSQVSIYRQVRK